MLLPNYKDAKSRGKERVEKELYNYTGDRNLGVGK